MTNLSMQPFFDSPPAQSQAQLHQNVCSIYCDQTLDPCHGNYSHIMDFMDPEVNQAISPINLLEQAIGTGLVPQAFLCCAQCNNQMKIYCMHLPSRYMGALDGRSTPWDGIVFPYLGKK